MYDEEKVLQIINKAEAEIAKIANRLRSAKAKSDRENLYLQGYIDSLIERLEPRNIFSSEEY